MPPLMDASAQVEFAFNRTGEEITCYATLPGIRWLAAQFDALSAAPGIQLALTQSDTIAIVSEVSLVARSVPARSQHRGSMLSRLLASMRSTRVRLGLHYIAENPLPMFECCLDCSYWRDYRDMVAQLENGFPGSFCELESMYVDDATFRVERRAATVRSNCKSETTS